jgi:DNA modification methylase
MVNTFHKTLISNAARGVALDEHSVHLVVTSPPYPMIEMWDEQMSSQNKGIHKALKSMKGTLAFESMHELLDRAWKEVERVLIPGGIACINIGDATRSFVNEFALYSNHSRIISAFLKLGFVNLPNILWRKQTNAPNKFMGSGMLPAGAYVTLEHEYILIFRKGGKRKFTTASEKKTRRESAYFWEERNCWFSDLWDLKGTRQDLGIKEIRARSAAFPFEVPYRLINMFSVKGDIVLDPFMGTGTCLIAAMASERNSIGVEIDEKLAGEAKNRIVSLNLANLNKRINERLERHNRFVVDAKNLNISIIIWEWKYSPARKKISSFGL